MTEFSGVNDGLSIRNFFEIDNPGAQCTGVLTEQLSRSAIWNHCWICGTPIDIGGDERPKECEHKFSILPALVVTGLYDARLRKALIATGRHDTYRQQLVNEYAYAHRRCNQVKSDVVFASLSYEGNNPRRVKCLANSTSIGATLLDILERPAQQVPTYTPQPDVLMRKLREERAWDGKATSFGATLDPLNPWTPDAWIKARTPVVGAAIDEAATKFNSKRLSAAVVKTHIVNAMLTRAIMISPRLVQEEMWGSLSDAGRELVTRSLAGAVGGRRTTRSRRKGTRRAMRGGDGEDIWVDLVSSRVKEARLGELATALEKAFATVATPEEYTAAVERVFAIHVGETDRETNRIVSTMSGGTWKGLIDSIEYQISIPRSGPMPRIIGIKNAGPLPVPGLTTPGRVPSDGSEGRTGSNPGLLSPFGTQAPQYSSLATAPGTQTASTPGTPTGSNPWSPVSPPGLFGRRGGFTFTMGKRPDWL
jgi:hypothetical protein